VPDHHHVRHVNHHVNYFQTETGAHRLHQDLVVQQQTAAPIDRLIEEKLEAENRKWTMGRQNLVGHRNLVDAVLRRGRLAVLPLVAVLRHLPHHHQGRLDTILANDRLADVAMLTNHR
jgi:hypothetical protein